MNRRPHMIHANSRGVIFRAKNGSKYGEETLDEGRYYLLETHTNFFGLSHAIDELRRRIAILPHVLFQFSDLPLLLFEAGNAGGQHWALTQLHRK